MPQLSTDKAKPRKSVRLRLLALALLPLVVVLPFLLGFTMVRWIGKFDDLLIAKVESDLRVAEQYLHRIEDTQAAQMAAVAQSVGFAEARSADNETLRDFLGATAEDLGLDFLILGSVADGSLPADARAISAVARFDEPVAGLALFSQEALTQISPDLADRSRFGLVPTEAARSIDRDVEDRGMVLLSAQRVSGTEGLLLGGKLLNRNLDFIDTMNTLIYRDGETDAARTGTTTLFLDDVRISTNVRLFEGSRALGTRVSQAVWEKVMMGGETWLDRAFVVNDWYISGYQPISDISGRRIGMLYTGFLEEPFSKERTGTVLTLALAFLGVLCISVPVFLRLAEGVFAPLERMSGTMGRVEKGELSARIGPVRSRDEIGEVASHLDRLLDQVQERDERLRDYADTLNLQVEERTKELQQANKQLEDTFAQLVMSEKLASIGEVTAGVAHEINNPVAVIQGNLEVIRSGLGADGRDYDVEFDLIDAQTHRINTIVRKLLNFTSSEETEEFASAVSPRSAVEDAAILVAADLRANAIEMVIDHREDTPDICVVASELQQVLVNLFINAMQAMDDEGTITVHIKPMARQGVHGAVIEVADTGPGIAPDKLEHVFDPFFTTKLAEGTGLGLSISQELVNRVGGIITVRSTLGEGAVFEVWCPAVDFSSKPTAKQHQEVDIVSI